MYLLDTDTIVYSLKGEGYVHEHLRRHRTDLLHLSVITLMELYFGAYRSKKVDANLAKIRTLEDSFSILQVGSEIASVFGSLKASSYSKGQPLDDFDLAIAATALAHNLCVVTNNEKHFRKIPGLKFENWFKKPI